MNKNELRKKLKNITASLSEEYKKEAGKVIAEKVISLPLFKESKTLFIYVSTANEPDTFSIIKEAWQHGKEVYVPKCFSSGQMQAVKLNSFDELSPNSFGIPEPETSDETAPDNFDMAIIPCISAWTDGSRLGHGGGYYDRFLEKHETKKVCICFEKLLSSQIPMEKYDIYMDCVVTESRTTETKRNF